MLDKKIMEDIGLLADLVAERRSAGNSLNASCELVADELDPERWTGGYLKTLLGERPPKPGDELRAAIRRLHRKKRRSPRLKRYWLKVEAETEEEKDIWIEMIPMERRQALFRGEIQRLLAAGEEPERRQGSFLRELLRLVGFEGREDGL